MGVVRGVAFRVLLPFLLQLIEALSFYERQEDVRKLGCAGELVGGVCDRWWAEFVIGGGWSLPLMQR